MPVSLPRPPGGVDLTGSTPSPVDTLTALARSLAPRVPPSTARSAVYGVLLGANAGGPPSAPTPPPPPPPPPLHPPPLPPLPLPRTKGGALALAATAAALRGDAAAASVVASQRSAALPPGLVAVLVRLAGEGEGGTPANGGVWGGARRPVFGVPTEERPLLVEDTPPGTPISGCWPASPRGRRACRRARVGAVAFGPPPGGGAAATIPSAAAVGGGGPASTGGGGGTDEYDPLLAAVVAHQQRRRRLQRLSPSEPSAVGMSLAGGGWCTSATDIGISAEASATPTAPAIRSARSLTVTVTDGGGSFAALTPEMAASAPPVAGAPHPTVAAALAAAAAAAATTAAARLVRLVAAAATAAPPVPPATAVAAVADAALAAVGTAADPVAAAAATRLVGRLAVLAGPVEGALLCEGNGEWGHARNGGTAAAAVLAALAPGATTGGLGRSLWWAAATPAVTAAVAVACGGIDWEDGGEARAAEGSARVAGVAGGSSSDGGGGGGSDGGRGGLPPCLAGVGMEALLSPAGAAAVVRAGRLGGLCRSLGIDTGGGWGGAPAVGGGGDVRPWIAAVEAFVKGGATKGGAPSPPAAAAHGSNDGGGNAGVAAGGGGEEGSVDGDTGGDDWGGGGGEGGGDGDKGDGGVDGDGGRDMAPASRLAMEVAFAPTQRRGRTRRGRTRRRRGRRRHAAGVAPPVLFGRLASSPLPPCERSTDDAPPPLLAASSASVVPLAVTPFPLHGLHGSAGGSPDQRRHPPSRALQFLGEDAPHERDGEDGGGGDRNGSGSGGCGPPLPLPVLIDALLGAPLHRLTSALTVRVRAHLVTAARLPAHLAFLTALAVYPATPFAAALAAGLPSPPTPDGLAAAVAPALAAAGLTVPAGGALTLTLTSTSPLAIAVAYTPPPPGGWWLDGPAADAYGALLTGAVRTATAMAAVAAVPAAAWPAAAAAQQLLAAVGTAAGSARAAAAAAFIADGGGLGGGGGGGGSSGGRDKTADAVDFEAGGEGLWADRERHRAYLRTATIGAFVGGGGGARAVGRAVAGVVAALAPLSAAAASAGPCRRGLVPMVGAPAVATAGNGGDSGRGGSHDGRWLLHQSSGGRVGASPGDPSPAVPSAKEVTAARDAVRSRGALLLQVLPAAAVAAATADPTGGGSGNGDGGASLAELRLCLDWNGYWGGGAVAAAGLLSVAAATLTAATLSGDGLRLFPPPAAASVDGSTLVESLGEARAARNGLEALELLAYGSDGDAVAVADMSDLRGRLRAAPLNRIRPACFTLLRAATSPGGAAATGTARADIERAYKRLIGAVDRLDNTSLRAGRGQIRGGGGGTDVQAAYREAVEGFSQFMAIVDPTGRQ
ncbi:hypothetical protein MMPV_001757 [Pyropia vietnamensis]